MVFTNVERWDEFKRRYKEKLQGKKELEMLSIIMQKIAISPNGG